MQVYMKYEDMICKFEKKHQPKRTYNPQKTPGKPWKVKGNKFKKFKIFMVKKKYQHTKIQQKIDIQNQFK